MIDIIIMIFAAIFILDFLISVAWTPMYFIGALLVIRWLYNYLGDKAIQYVMDMEDKE